MAIENFFTTEFTIKSLEDIESTSKEQFGEESATIYYCYLIEFTGELEEFFDGGVRKAYQIRFDRSVPLQQGMKIIIDSVEYEVASVKDNNIIRSRNMSANKHKKAMIYKTT